MSCKNSSSAQQLAIASGLIAAALAENLSANEINVLGNFITSIGAALLVIAAQLSSEQSNMQNGNTTNGNSKNKNSKK
ncbi:hypothetical protein [Clostridium brassicae]|uniref:Holin n=1 Tax=Clostridium brassicae TaxID=2999072 RepID=A0ABT4DBT6_9CLOT|nr:hypothetical protein [Clostridium brassicae]MCY6959773.1 hypothetical protein [Clostridium brassicae]